MQVKDVGVICCPVQNEMTFNPYGVDELGQNYVGYAWRHLAIARTNTRYHKCGICAITRG